MGKTEARVVANNITYEQLIAMFNNVKASDINWKSRSVINRGLSKGTVWNIMYPSLLSGHYKRYAIRVNMVREFGDFLPKELRVSKTKAVNKTDVHHEEPQF